MVASESTKERNSHSAGERGIQEGFGELTVITRKHSPEKEEEGH